MAQQTAESIGHFIGYLHLQDLLNLSTTHYWGAPEIHFSPYDPDGVSGPDLLVARWPGAGSYDPPWFSGRADGAPDPTVVATLGSRSVGPLPHTEFLALVGGPVEPAPVLQAPLPPAFFDFKPNLTVTVTYTFGGSQNLGIDVRQANTLTDDDVVIGDPSMVSAENLEAAKAHVEGAAIDLAELVATAQEAVPGEVADLFAAPPGELDKAYDHSDNGLLPQLADADGTAGVQQVAANGQFVNGEQVAPFGEGRAEQLEGVLEQAELVAKEDEVLGDPAAPASDPSDIGASYGAAQITTLGGNAAVNAAVLQDFGDAYGSSIILGDYYETNAIIQINVLSDIDEVSIVGESIFGQLRVDDNTLLNDASFTNTPGEIYGDVEAGGYPGALDWQVDYVNGDYFDVTTVTQHNLLSDNDTNFGTPTQAHHSAILGENGQLNVEQIGELGTQYELIIVAGDYFKYNGIIQLNVLLDNDNVTLIGGGNGEATQAYDTGGNQLINDASIHSVGGMSYKSVSGNAKDLAKAIGDGESEFDYEMAFALPGNGDDVFDVLYVTGGYYTYNVIYQTNVVSDADFSQDSMAGSTDPYEQSTEAGGNALANAAFIIDQDATSDYRFLEGEVYEETLLVQANILGEDGEDGEDPKLYGDDLDEDVVAALAAMAEDASSPATASESEQNQFLVDSGDVDVMGGVLS